MACRNDSFHSSMSIFFQSRKCDINYRHFPCSNSFGSRTYLPVLFNQETGYCGKTINLNPDITAGNDIKCFVCVFLLKYFYQYASGNRIVFWCLVSLGIQPDSFIRILFFKDRKTRKSRKAKQRNY